jgi:transcriptional regulator with XRE-family HTH domain
MQIAQLPQNIGAVRRQLGANVRYWRNRRSWTQDQLAERANLSAKFLGEIERGEDNPSLETLWALVCALKIDWADLLATQKPTPS